MSQETELRRHIGKVETKLTAGHRGKKPELQFHMAATLIMAGDPHGITKNQRADKIDELIQVAGRFPEKWTGEVRCAQIDRVINDLKKQIVDALRARGVLKAGE